MSLNLQVELIQGVSNPVSYDSDSEGYNNSSIVSDCNISYTTDCQTELTIDTVCKWVEGLRTFKVNGISSPHKPVYLLTIIKLISEGIIDDKIYLNNMLIDTFKNVWNEVVPTPNSFTADICNPYIHMASEPFYHLHMVKDMPYSQIPKNIQSIRAVCDYAELDYHLIEFLKKYDNSVSISSFICKKFILNKS